MSDEDKAPLLLPAPEFAHVNEMSIDVVRRRLYVSEIGVDDGEWMVKALSYLNALSLGNPIELYLNTPGGDVTGMFAIHDAIRMSKSPVHCYAFGEVVSAGVLILACCHKRYVSESCVLMSHEPKVGGGEDEDGLGLRAAKDRRKWEDWIHTHWCDLMARYTPDKDAKWWKRVTERGGEYWLLGGEAIVAEGLADAVMAAP